MLLPFELELALGFVVALMHVPVLFAWDAWEMRSLGSWPNASLPQELLSKLRITRISSYALSFAVTQSAVVAGSYLRTDSVWAELGFPAVFSACFAGVLLEVRKVVDEVIQFQSPDHPSGANEDWP